MPSDPEQAARGSHDPDPVPGPDGDAVGNAPPNPRASQRYLFGTDVWRLAQDDQLQRGSEGWGRRLALWTGLRDRITGGDAWVPVRADFRAAPGAGGREQGLWLQIKGALTV